MIPQQQPRNENYQQEGLGVGAVPSYTSEEEITNIVGQIDPANILDNMNHSLKGEYYNKEKGVWEKVGEELVNATCRGWIISYFNSIMNNASTMGIISEEQLSNLMIGIINTVTKSFKYNLERFGFVPPGKYYSLGEFENKGTPDTSRMSDVGEMIYRSALLILSRSIKGSESRRIFKSLNMHDVMDFGQDEQKSGAMSRLFKRG